MKNILNISKSNFYFILFTLASVFYSFGQRTISSVSDLAEMASRSGQTVVMEPGVYQMQDYLTPRVINNTPRDGRGASSMITFSGSNNTFDLTGVTIEVNTALLNDFRTRVMEFYVTGNNVTIKGLTVTDIGTSPTHNGGQSFVVDGKDNTIENVTLNVRGSSEYGYGDLLGKGDANLVKMRKHSGMLIEGLNINIIGCSVFSRAIGHLFFIQGGRNVLFKDCYAEAVTRTTNNMLSETSGPAFDLGFASVYRNLNGDKMIAPGYTKSLSEVGFRAYRSGGIEGNTTGAITLINCKAKNTRSGFAFTRYDGDVLMQNCEAIGCEAGFQVQEVTIENSRGDAVNGPLMYLNGGASDVELELIPNVNRTTLHAIATIGGNNHNVTLKSSGSIRPEEHPILIGSTRPSGANPFSPMGTTSTSNLTLNNCTGMPIVIGSTASSNTITTNGSFTDKGSRNRIITSNNCSTSPTPPSTNGTLVHITKRNATGFAIDGGNGGSNGQNVTLSASNTSDQGQLWVEIDRGNGFYSYEKFGTNFSLDGNGGGARRQSIYIWKTSATNQNQQWRKVAVGNGFKLIKRNATDFAINGSSGGREGQDVTLYDSDNTSQNLQWFLTPIAENVRLEAEDFDRMSGIKTEASIESGDNVGFINTNDWLRFDDVNLSGITNMDARVASKSTGGTIEVRTGSTTGTLIGSINVNTTGGHQNWKTLNTSIRNATGTQDVYLVFKGGSGYLFNVNWIEFNRGSESNKENTPTPIISDIIMYPNPVNEIMTIQNAANSIITIYDIKGSEVLTQSISNDNETIDVSSMNAGIYYGKVRNDVTNTTLKIVKN